MTEPSRGRQLFNTVLGKVMLWIFKAKLAIQARKKGTAQEDLGESQGRS